MRAQRSLFLFDELGVHVEQVNFLQPWDFKGVVVVDQELWEGLELRTVQHPFFLFGELHAPGLG